MKPPVSHRRQLLLLALVLPLLLPLHLPFSPAALQALTSISRSCTLLLLLPRPPSLLPPGACCAVTATAQRGMCADVTAGIKRLANIRFDWLVIPDDARLRSICLGAVAAALMDFDPVAPVYADAPHLKALSHGGVSVLADNNATLAALAAWPFEPPLQTPRIAVRNISCDSLPIPVPYSSVTFLILPTRIDQADTPAHKVVRSIRTHFPSARILISDYSGLPREHTGPSVSVVRAHRRDVRNELVRAARGDFLVLLTAGNTLTRDTHIGAMLHEVSEGAVEVVGGYVRLEGGVFVGDRYAFTSETTLTRKPVTMRNVSADCVRVHKTTPFIVARRITLTNHVWKGEYEFLSSDEFYVRIMRKGIRVAVCDSGVTAAATEEHADSGDPVIAGRRLCGTWDRELGDIEGLGARGFELDCQQQRVCWRGSKIGSPGGKWTCREW